jgi:hypothetical protein
MTVTITITTLKPLIGQRFVQYNISENFRKEIKLQQLKQSHFLAFESHTLSLKAKLPVFLGAFVTWWLSFALNVLKLILCPSHACCAFA